MIDHRLLQSPCLDVPQSLPVMNLANASGEKVVCHQTLKTTSRFDYCSPLWLNMKAWDDFVTGSDTESHRDLSISDLSLEKCLATHV